MDHLLRTELEDNYEMEDTEISIHESDLNSLCLLLNVSSEEVRDMLNNETGTIQININNDEAININCYFDNY